MAPVSLAGLPVPTAVEGQEIVLLPGTDYIMNTKGVEARLRLVDQA
jgi:hypothetical protein